MPRDGSGVYTLPSGNPVTTGTLIQSTWANPTMTDIAVQFNNVLTRDGVLGPTLAFKLVDGTTAAPGLAFNSEPGLGAFRQATSIIALTAVNAVAAQFNFSNSLGTTYAMYPRAAGQSTIVLADQIYGSTNHTDLQIGQNAAGSFLASTKSGTNAIKPISYQALNHIFSNEAGRDPQITLNKGASGFNNYLVGQTNGLNRWVVNLGGGTTESGSNAGSDFTLSRNNDAGVFIDNPLSIVRSTGTVSVAGTINVGAAVNAGTSSTASSFIAINGMNFGANPGAAALIASTYVGTANRTINIFDGSVIGGTAVIAANHIPGTNASFQFTILGALFQMLNSGTGASSGGWIATSDQRVKENMLPIGDALSKLRTLTGYTYDKTDMRGLDGVAPRKAGYIAQDVQIVLPEAITVADDDMGTLSVDHNAMIGLLINAVKELDARTH